MMNAAYVMVITHHVQTVPVYRMVMFKKMHVAYVVVTDPPVFTVWFNLWNKQFIVLIL